MSNSKLNAKDITTRIAMDTLGFVFAQARGEVGKAMLDVARKWGATIPAESESQFINQISELFTAPAQWPPVEVVGPATVAGMSNSEVAEVAISKKVGGRKKQASDKAPTTKRKAADYRTLTVPAGMAIPKCPALIKTGDNSGKPCGRECKKVLDEDDPKEPECARLECGHCYCGSHVTKADVAGAGASKTRLDSSADPDAAPVVVHDEEGGSTKINAAAVGATETKVQAKATKEAMSRLHEKMKMRRAQKKDEEGEASETKTDE